MLRKIFGRIYYGIDFTNMPQSMVDKFHYAIQNYGYILPNDKKDYTYKQFAKMIENTFDMTNPRNKEIVEILKAI
jgi:hypothetical protein